MEMYENPWIYQGKEVTFEDLKGYAGFVYLITDTINNRLYVGRKYVWSSRRVKKKARRSRTESDWTTYYGSNEFLKAEVKKHGTQFFKREILHIGKTKGEVNFLEIEEQFKRDVLYKEEYYNDQIQGKYFKKNVIRYKK